MGLLMNKLVFKKHRDYISFYSGTRHGVYFAGNSTTLFSLLVYPVEVILVTYSFDGSNYQENSFVTLRQALEFCDGVIHE